MSMAGSRLRISIWTALIAGVFTALLTLFSVQGLERLVLFAASDDAPVSMAAITVIASFLIVLVTTAVHYRRLAPTGDRVSWMYQLSGRIGAALLSAAFMTFVSAIALGILQKVFPGGTLPVVAAIFLLNSCPIVWHC